MGPVLVWSRPDGSELSLNAPGVVDSWSSLEVFGDGFLGNFLDVEVRQCGPIHFEFSVVIRENQGSTLGEFVDGDLADD